MSKATDVVIIGGGVIGCAIAYCLRKASVEVTVLEQGEIGGQASSAAVGLLAPLGLLSGPGAFADLLLAGFALFPSFVPELEEASGLSLHYKQTGTFRAVTTPESVNQLKGRMQDWQPLGLQMSWLTGAEARQREPMLTADVLAALYAPEESQINAIQVVQAFAQAAKNLGATIQSHTKVTGIQRNGMKVTGVKTAQDEISCHTLVLATGAWSACYGKWFGSTFPLSPSRGQALSMQQPSVPLRQIIFGNEIYLVPRGRSIIVGATRENVGFDTQVTEEGIAWLRDTAVQLLPTLRESAIERTWAGLRPKTPDKQPILGPLPNWEHAILATGHNGFGIILSAMTGKTIAELIITEKTPEIIQPFSLGRYGESNCSPTIRGSQGDRSRGRSPSRLESGSITGARSRGGFPTTPANGGCS